ncbi:MAG: ABC transporter permease [Lewinellaceae bacterium]|nr:ABC transporter permease [Lewinellaceae bacterium]
MLRNYFKIALRNLLKNRLFSSVNIFGLAIGMTACLLILQYVSWERSYDQFHENKERIFRIAMEKYEPGEAKQDFAFTFPAVAPHLLREFPEVEKATRIRRTGGVVAHEDQRYGEQGIIYADSSLFDIFSFGVSRGDIKAALSEPYKGAVSEAMARKYFGAENPIGQTLEIGTAATPFEVAAVFEDIPENSHLAFDFAFSYVTYIDLAAARGGDAENSWGWSDFYTYVMLRPGTEITSLEEQLPAFAERHMGESMEEGNYKIRFFTQPLEDIYLNSHLGYEYKPAGNARYVYAMMAIALFIILIAWFNYINLSTARSLDRAREVGVRKVVGARRGQLLRQFLLESALVNFVALGLALLAANSLMPAFGRLVGKAISFSLLQVPWFWGFVALLFTGGALLAGLYPAFILSAHRPVLVLKSHKSAATGAGGGLRKGLVALQFIATIALIAGSLAIYRQINFMRQEDLGVDIDQTLVLRDVTYKDSTFTDRIRTFKEELLRWPGVKSVAASGDIPGKEVGNSWGLRWANSPSSGYKRFRTFLVDRRFFRQYGAELIAGREFDVPFEAGRQATVLNETAVRVFGFDSPEAALGEEILASNGQSLGRVVGVIKDYHQESLQFDFKPICYYYQPYGYTYYSIKAEVSDPRELVRFAEGQWKGHFPESPVSAFFLDEFYEAQYQADLRFGFAFGLFTLLAIIVACLGLFGLSSFSVARRTKEIGVRKVLGASVSQILVLLSEEYVRLVLAASVLALPVAYYFLKKWLDNFAFGISLSWWFFLLPVFLALAIAAVTVSYQAIRAAVRNPVEALRYE